MTIASNIIFDSFLNLHFVTVQYIVSFAFDVCYTRFISRDMGEKHKNNIMCALQILNVP